MKINSSVCALTLAVILMASCQTDKKVIAPPLTKDATSAKGMVSTAHPLATQAALMMLEQGGNAADAAVAAGFTLSVVEPAMSGLGGRLQAIIYTPEGEVVGIDASTEAPLSYDKETATDAPYGYPIIGIPGVVAGLIKLHDDHGSLPLSTIMKPAIGYARNGCRILPGAAELFSLVKDQLLEFEGTKQYYIKDDTTTYAEGDLLVQEDLARTLEAIQAYGTEVFYKGEIAEKIVADMESHGGYVDKISLAAYEAKNSEVLSGNYRGVEVYGLWLPSFGAITIEALNILSKFPLSDLSESEWASAVYQATKLAYNDRLAQLHHNSDFFLNPYRADSLAELINIRLPDTVLVGDNTWQNPRMLAMQGQGHTTHLSVADSEGGMVALTQSLGPIMGSKVATPGLGFMYASTLGSYLGPFSPAPGQRAVSHISPTIVLKDGKPYMALGAAGGDRIVTAVVQVISRIVDERMSLPAALAAPRVHPARPGGMDLELHEGIEWQEEDFLFLKEQGLLINPRIEPSRFGRVHAVLYQDELQTWVGAADPDWEGTAAGPEN